MDEELRETSVRKSKKNQKPILTEEELKKRRARKTRIATASFVLILGVGILGNWYYQNSDFSANVQPLIESSKTKTLGEAEYVGATAQAQDSKESQYFSKARLERQNARDEALENLQKILDSGDENSQSKAKASEEIARLSNIISAENKIETLILAKGVDNCLAVVSTDGEHIDIIVDCDELGDSLIVQIKDTAMQQLGCSYEAVSIIQAK